MPDHSPDLGALDVSRETVERLERFVALTLQWTKKINLISRNSQSEIWTRHILDSLQIARLAPDKPHWADLGSGGGFPALAVACDYIETRPNCAFTLVESDQRKAAFLRTVIAQLGLNAKVISKRIEGIPPLHAGILSARALAPLCDLCGYANIHLAETGICLFPKGENYQAELDESLESWAFQSDIHRSITNPNAAILQLWDIHRA